MVSGCSTLVQFQAVHEVRALHCNQLKAALPSFKNLKSVRKILWKYYATFAQKTIFENLLNLWGN